MKFMFLLLLVNAVPILCHSIEYCVRPTDSSSAPVHNGHTCQTLNQYLDDPVHYFTSNTRFRFLPGNHKVNAPVIIQNIENVSLEAFDSSVLPLIMPHFSCRCDDPDISECSKCSAFQFQNITNVSFKDMNIVPLSGIDMRLKLNITYGIAIILTKSMHLSNITVRGGIIIQSSSGTAISSAVIYNTLLDGIHIQGSSKNTTIVNTTIANTSLFGIYVDGADKVAITDTRVMNCGFHGIRFSKSTNFTVKHIQIFNSSWAGIFLWNCRHFVITNTAVVQSHHYGFYIMETEDGTVKSAEVIVTGLKLRLNTLGIVMTLTKNVLLSNVTVIGGIVLNSTNSTTISSSLVFNTILQGIYIQGSAKNTTIVNTTVANISASGIYVESADETVITDTRIMNCGYDGILFKQSTNSIVNNTIIFNTEGLMLDHSRYFVITNIVVAHTNLIGIFIWETEDVTIKSAKVIDSLGIGVNVFSSRNVVIGVSEIQDSVHAVDVYNTTDSTIFNTIILNCSSAGISIDSSQNVINENIRVLISLQVAKLNSSNSTGIFIANSKNTSVTNAVVKSTKNSACSVVLSGQIDYTVLPTSVCGYDGIRIESSNDTFMTNTSIQGGIVITGAKHTSLWYATVNVTTGIYLVLSNHTRVYNSEIISGTSLRNMYVGMMVVKCSYVMLSKVSFSEFTGPPYISTAFLPAVVGLETTTGVVLTGCIFANNSVSALKVTNSDLVFTGNISFKNNHAIKGGAITLSQESFLNIAPNANVTFESNSASYGGAIYMNERDISVLYESTEKNGTISAQLKQHPCFLRGDEFHKSLFFINNTAHFGGDILYGGNVEGTYTSRSRHEQCIMLFQNISNITPQEKQLSLITSEPSRVCHCSSSYKPDCYTLSKAISVYPGQTTTIPAVLVGQGLGTIAGSVFADFLDDVYQPSLGTLQESQQVFQHQCNNLSYTIFAPQDDIEVVLVLTTSNVKAPLMTNELVSELIEVYNQHDPMNYPFEFLQMPIYVNVTLLPCLLGFQLSGRGSCNCIEMLKALPGVTCSIQHQTVARSGLVWIGAAKGDNQTTTIMTAEYCPLRYCKSESVNVSLYHPDTQCNYGHSGTLCGGCPSNFSSVLGSAQCLPCSNKCLSLIIPFAFAGFALVFFLKIFDFTLSSGTINGLIFYANVIKVNEALFLSQERSPLSIFISWINLDLGIQTCFFNGMTTYWKTWLQFVFPFYIWIIAGAIIITAKHSRRVSKAMGNNSVPVLATLFLLSYAKLLRTVITALSYSVVKHPHGQKYVWSADGNIEYLGSQHAPLFLAAVAVLVFLYLPYTIFLLVGQWLHRCQARPVVHFMIKMKPFLDAHYGCLKEKHRYWFGTLLLIRASILLLSTLIPVSNVRVVIFSISVTALALVLFQSLCLPYSVATVIKFEISFFINLAVLSLTTFYTTTAESQTVAAYVSISFALFHFLGLLTFKICKILKEKTQLWNMLVECFKKRGVDDELAFLDYDREANEMNDVCDMDSGDEEENLRFSEEPPTYGF